jgi:L-ascorbate metabolism protein UlaG (beta-lactamase superfamily)
MRSNAQSFALIVIAWLSTASHADDAATLRVHYLANAGVMIAHGDTKILFDPFFRNDYGQFELLPKEMEAAIFAGSPPWDGIDAIFISHQHDDHFDPAIVMQYLLRWPNVMLYAPQQAVDSLLDLNEAAGNAVLDRVHGVALQPDSEPAEIEMDELDIEAVHVAHAGWPGRHTEVDNIVFRVTLDSSVTVMHLGDADAAEELYTPHESFWGERRTRVAVLPVWLLLTDKGRYTLETFVDAEHEIGVHVYNRIPENPAERPPEFRGLDIFKVPGEIRDFK